MSVNGEWNGVMYATHANNSEPEVFVDTFTMPIVKKQVQSIGKQKTFESRRYTFIERLYSRLSSTYFHSFPVKRNCVSIACRLLIDRK